MAILRSIIGIPFVVWFILAGVGAFFIYQEWKTGPMLSVQNELKNQKQLLKTLKSRNTQAVEFEKQKREKLSLIQSLAGELNSNLESLPRQAGIPSLLQSLADIADATGLEFSRFEPGVAMTEGFLTVSTLKVSLTGSYSQVMSFLDAASNLKRIVSARSLELREPVSKGDTSLVKAKALLMTYHMEGGDV